MPQTCTSDERSLIQTLNWRIHNLESELKEERGSSIELITKVALSYEKPLLAL